MEGGGGGRGGITEIKRVVEVHLVFRRCWLTTIGHKDKLYTVLNSSNYPGANVVL